MYGIQTYRSRKIPFPISGVHYSRHAHAPCSHLTESSFHEIPVRRFGIKLSVEYPIARVQPSFVSRNHVSQSAAISHLD
jgi:hypothetical protein